MSARSRQKEWSGTLPQSLRITSLLAFVAACFALVVVGVLTKQIDRDQSEPYRTAVAEIAANDHEAASGAGAPLESVFGRTLEALAKELLKQAIDQPGHFLIAAIPIWLSRRLTGVPWYGWPVVPLLAYREWLQWPSNRWWDPPLDWAVLALGVIVATWILTSLRRPAPARA